MPLAGVRLAHLRAHLPEGEEEEGVPVLAGPLELLRRDRVVGPTLEEEHGLRVLGVDVDPETVERLRSGQARLAETTICSSWVRTRTVSVTSVGRSGKTSTRTSADSAASRAP